jgi:formylglycine-generating enzyme required for sulfatase activity
MNNYMNCRNYLVALLILITGLIAVNVQAAKPNLVLLPIEVSKQDFDLEAEYGSALQQGLQNRYTVFYGEAVKKELKKEYEKINCDSETCNQNVAIAFNGELIADGSVKNIAGGYLLKLVVRNVLTSEVIETTTLACERCSQFDVIRRLKNIGIAAADNSKTQITVTGSVSTAATVNAKVVIDGKAVGNTPYQGLNHKIGDKVKVQITHEYYRPYLVSLDLQQAITQLEPIALVQGQGRVLIASKPFKADSIIYVNGQAKGRAPLTLMLPAGDHSVQIKAKNESTDVQRLTVNDGVDIQQLLPFSAKVGQIDNLSLQGFIMDMVAIPGGTFQMGCDTFLGCDTNQEPVHKVYISPFKMSKTEVTFANWDICVKAGSCSYKPEDQGWGRIDRPVIKVSYNDITQQYIPWLNKATGKKFRLPSEAEWEYAARAGNRAQYSWGNKIGIGRANCSDCGTSTGRKKTTTVGSFKPNDLGLYDMHGNVWEWTQDCRNDSYYGAPNSGKVWDTGDCSDRMVRGGSWYDHAKKLRSAIRYSYMVTERYSNIGFRLVQSM